MLLVNVSRSRMVPPGAADPCGPLGQVTDRWGAWSVTGSDPVQQRQDQKDDENEPDQPARSIAAPVVTPSRKRADQEQNENDDENGGEHRGLQAAENLANAACAGRFPSPADAGRHPFSIPTVVPNSPDAPVSVQIGR